MAYAQASTANPLGRRPWSSRLQGLSYYQRENFLLPSATPGQSARVAGLGLDLSSGMGLATAAGVALLALWLIPRRRKR